MVNPGLNFQYNQAAGCFMFWDDVASQWFYYNRQDDRLVYPDARVPRPVNVPASYYLDPRSPAQPVPSLPRDDFTAISPTLGPRYVTEDQRRRRVSSGDASLQNPRLGVRDVRADPRRAQPEQSRRGPESREEPPLTSGSRNAPANSGRGSQRRGSQQRDQGTQLVDRMGQMNIQGNPQSRSTDPTVPNTILLVNERTGARTAVQPEPQDLDVLFPGYYMRRPSDNFFVVGRVFKTLWAEPVGGTTVARPNTNPHSAIVPARFRGERIYTNIRRFVVVRAFKNFCHAIPIVSYQQQGVGKDTVVKSEYAIIYTGKEPPDPMPSELPREGERGLRPRSIRVVPDNPAVEWLDSSSRIQFSGIRTIQHNLKVKAVGMVHEHSMDALLSQLRAVERDADGRHRPEDDYDHGTRHDDDHRPGPSNRGQMRSKGKERATDGRGAASKGKERARDGHSTAGPSSASAQRLPPASAEQALWANKAVLEHLKQGYRMNQAMTAVAHLVRAKHPGMTMETAELQVSALLAQAKAIRKRQRKNQESSEESSTEEETD